MVVGIRNIDAIAKTMIFFIFMMRYIYMKFYFYAQEVGYICTLNLNYYC